MASIYFELRATSNKRGEQPIRLVIIVNRKSTRTNTGYAVKAKDWDDGQQQIKQSHPSANSWNKALSNILKDARDKYGDLDVAGGVKASKVAKAVKVGALFQDIAMHYSEKFREDGKIGTADAYKSRAKRIELVFPKVRAIDMDKEWAEDFKALAKKKYSHNTIVGFLKFINSVLAKAESDGIITRNPMEKVSKGSYRAAKKEPLTPVEINKMWDTKPANDREAIAKDTFLFSYYCSGARFKDVLLMPIVAIKGKRLEWTPYKTEEKTGESLEVEINRRMTAIIRRNINPTDTIFGLVNPSLPPEELDKSLASTQDRIRRDLKLFLARCGITKDITFHDARRTLSKHIKALGADLHDIKDVLGHGDIKTTQGYVGRDQVAKDKILKRVYKK